MSAAALNHARNSNSTESSNSFTAHQRETVEAKLYYMRDVCDPEQFEAYVDEELLRAKFKPIASTGENNIQNLAGKPKIYLARFCKALCIPMKLQSTNSPTEQALSTIFLDLRGSLLFYQKNEICSACSSSRSGLRLWV